MLAGKCPKCGATYSGWALKSPWYQLCDNCDSEIEIKDYQSKPLTTGSPDVDEKSIGPRQLPIAS